jgi:hypothetical protein
MEKDNWKSDRDFIVKREEEHQFARSFPGFALSSFPSERSSDKNVMMDIILRQGQKDFDFFN